jgi:hypothetical protein
LNLGINYEEISDDYNSNDLGFVQRNNLRDLELFANYGIFEPFGPMNRANFWVESSYRRTIIPDAFSRVHFNAGFWMQSRQFWNYNMWFNYSPQSYDFFEPRTFGRYLQVPAYSNMGGWIGTDDRKKFRFSGYFDYSKYDQEGRTEFDTGIDPRYRFSNKFRLSLGLSLSTRSNEIGFVNKTSDDIILGYRDRTTISNEVRANYTFNDKMGLMFRMRHYWSKVAYDKFGNLNQDGSLSTTDYYQFHDLAFNVFNIDMEYRWRFAPGSDIFIVWKNNISGVDSDVNTNFRSMHYEDGIRQLNSLPQSNSISLRVVYYLDYNSL